MKTKPQVIDVFSDNGELSHWALIDPETGVKLWSEDPEECKAMGHPVKPSDLKELKDITDEDVAVELIARYSGNSRGNSISKQGFVDCYNWLKEKGYFPVQKPLKKLEDISDVDAIEVANLINWGHLKTGSQKIEWTKEWLNMPTNQSITFTGMEHNPHRIFKVYQYLQSRGYLLPVYFPVQRAEQNFNGKEGGNDGRIG